MLILFKFLQNLDNSLIITPLTNISSYQVALTAWSSLIHSCHPPHHQLLLAVLLGCILCPYRADVSPSWSTNTNTSMC